MLDSSDDLQYSSNGVSSGEGVYDESALVVVVVVTVFVLAGDVDDG